MLIDPENPVVALCAEGMSMEGDSVSALALFQRAWDARTDAYDASIAAHFIARHQTVAVERLRWNEVAIDHAKTLDGLKRAPLMPSLYLNLADSLLENGRMSEAREAVQQGVDHLDGMPEDGYSQFVLFGLVRLRQRLTGEDEPG